MVFEEFFLKKKIDLAQLKDADPSLFDQFKSHYYLMGEKSFDHTKKYWFNKLRHSYPLSTEEEIRLKELFKGEKAVEKSEAITVEAKTETAVAKPAGFRPKFKAPVSTKKQEETSASLPPLEITPPAETTAENAVEVKPTGFKPRFKPGVTKTPIASGTEDRTAETAQEETVASVAKPSGFTPRFKAGLTKTVAAEENKSALSPETENTAGEEQTDTPKPLGFKPRFKPGVTKTIQTEEENQTATTENPNPDVPTENTGVSKPVGFKPRFKASQPPISVNKEITEENSEIQEVKTDDTAATAKPLGFKPRFKAGQTKVAEAKPEQSEASVDETANSETIEVAEKKAENQPDEADTPAIKPLGFKPRFKPKNKNDE